VENIPYMLEGFRHDPQIPESEKTILDVQLDRGIPFVGHELAHHLRARLVAARARRPALRHSVLSYNLPHITRFIVTLSMVGVASSAVLSVMLLPEKPGGLTAKDYAIFVLQWVLMPFTLIIFGAFPGLEAQTR
jgi:hypothetical protein